MSFVVHMETKSTFYDPGKFEFEFKLSSLL